MTTYTAIHIVPSADLGDDAQYWRDLATGEGADGKWLDRLPIAVRAATTDQLDVQIVGRRIAMREFSVRLGEDDAIVFEAVARLA